MGTGDSQNLARMIGEMWMGSVLTPPCAEALATGWGRDGRMSLMCCP